MTWLLVPDRLVEIFQKMLMSLDFYTKQSEIKVISNIKIATLVRDKELPKVTQIINLYNRDE